MSFITPQNRNRVLYVGGIADEVTDDLLRAAFIPFGDITEVMVPVDFRSGKHRGFGFVEFELREDAQAALDNMNHAELFGRVLNINIARNGAMDKNRSVWEQQADEYFDVGQEAKEGGGEGEGEGGDGEAAAPESGEGDAASSPKGKERAGMDLVED